MNLKFCHVKGYPLPHNLESYGTQGKCLLKTLLEKEEMLLPACSSFPTMFSTPLKIRIQF